MPADGSLRAAWLWAHRKKHTAIFTAIRLSDVSLLQTLVEVHHADINTKHGKESALFWIAHIGDINLLAYVLTIPSLDINVLMPESEDAPKTTILHLAHSSQFLDLLLTHASIDVNKLCGYDHATMLLESLFQLLSTQMGKYAAPRGDRQRLLAFGTSALGTQIHRCARSSQPQAQRCWRQALGVRASYPTP